jgi:hypothetical protein
MHICSRPYSSTGRDHPRKNFEFLHCFSLGPVQDHRESKGGEQILFTEAYLLAMMET